MELVMRTSQVLSVTGTSAKFTNAIERGFLFRLSANGDIWFLVGATGAAATAGSSANSHFLAKGQIAYISAPDTSQSWFVHCIQDSANCKASLSRLEGI